MGLFDTIFKSTIDKRVNALARNIIQPALTNLYNENIFRWLNTGIPIVQENNQTYIDAFNNVGPVFECVDIIAKKVVACPRIVYRIKDQAEYKKFLNYSKSSTTLGKALIAKAKALEEVHIPEIEKLLNNPNKLQNGDDFLETTAGLFLLTGNAYVYGNSSQPSKKKWSEIYALPTDMKIISGGPLDPIEGYKVNFWTDPEMFPAAQIKHIKTFNPNYSTNGRQLYGLAPLRSQLFSLDIIENADKQADKQMKNGGIFGLITPENKEDQLTEPQKQDMHDRISSARKSNDELSRMIPASIGLKWTQIGLASGDLQLLEISDAKADGVYRVYHIPLQFRNQDSATYNNLPVANRKFVFDAVAPICRKIDVGLTEFICPAYNTATETYVIHLDFMGLPELNDDMVAAVTWLQNSPFLTMNEKREVIGYGRSAEAGMDQILVNRNTVLLADVLSGKVTTQSNNNSGSGLVN
jgi:HK97 family phage portal protein